jgi:acyl-CoA reductase-like NAD-dependent aldehyde dehydrogenase
MAPMSEAAAATTLPVLDKYTGETIAEVPIADAAAVDRAVRRARDAFPAWSETPAHRRSSILRAAAGAIDQRKDEITALIAREAGKAWKHAAGEVARGVETFTFSAEEAKRIHGETVPMDASVFGEKRVGFYHRVPLGVVSAITPFNFPLNLVAHKVGPALAAGNTVVLKPAEETPLTAVRMAECLRDAGLPEGVLEIVHGDGPTTGEALVRHPGPAKVSFTGSPPVGAHILSVAGLKRITLELGNNSGAIVEPDANLDLAVPRTVMSAFANAGQVCLSLQRLYVHETIADTFLERFVAATRALKVGNPLDRDCDVGPMISDEAAERADAWIKEAVDQGARLLVEGRREGRLLWPTVLTNTRNEMKVMCREAFAPLVCVIAYREFDDALRLLADTPYGLQAGLYTRDLHKAFRAVAALDMGGIMVNDTSMFRVDHMPYGGNRMSGIGREGVRYAIEEMTNIKFVCFNLE